MSTSSSAALVESAVLEIVSDKRIGLIHECCMHTVRSHTPSGAMIYGRERLIDRALVFLATFPDAELALDGTVTAQRSNGEVSVFVSGRVTATHRGAGVYGPPTGKSVAFDCALMARVKGDRIVEQWIHFDEAALTALLGIDVDALVAERAAVPDPVGDFTRLIGEVENGIGQLSPPRTDAGPVHRLLFEVGNRRNPGAGADLYAEEYRYRGPGGEETVGRPAAVERALAFVAPFPDGTFFVDETIDHGSAAVVRWTFLGTHLNPGRFGAPTRTRLTVPGATHLVVRDGLVVEERTYYGLLDMQKAIARGRVRSSPEAPQRAAYGGKDGRDE